MRGLVVVLSITAVLGFASASGAQSCLAGGVEVGGSCWFFGNQGQSCDTVCAGAGPGVVYDDATRAYAGSDGSDGNCAQVLDALSVPGAGVTSTICNVGGVGCNYEQGGRFRCVSPPTDSASGYVDLQRACACRIPAGAPAPAMSWVGLFALLSVLGGIGAHRLWRRGTSGPNS